MRGTEEQASCSTGVDGTQTTRPLHAGRYRLEGFQGIPADSYVASATVGAQDALNGDFELVKGNLNLEVRVRRGAAVAGGKVTDSQGRVVHDAVVAAIPDSRAARPLATLAYPSDRTDQNGVFEIRGLSPGLYRLYAWSVLEEAALRDPDFLRRFEGRGNEINIRESDTVLKDLKILDEAQ